MRGGVVMEIKSINESIVFSGNTFTKRVLFADKQVLSFVLNLQAGQALPSHKHEKSTVVLNVLSGSGEIKINDELGRLEKGFVLTAKGEDDFEIPRVTEDMSLFVTISPNPSNEMYSKDI